MIRFCRQVNKTIFIMGQHSDYSNPFNDYSLPSFIEDSNFPINNKDIVIELGEGTFTMDFTLLFNLHNVTIKGQGRDKTILVIPVTINNTDDCIIGVYGKYQLRQGQETDERVSVSIKGLTIRTNVTKVQAEQEAYWLTQHESYIIKCNNVNSLIMRDVRIVAENIETTCIDIRRGFNIDIQGCEFINRNRRWTGGNIWLRGDIENVIIKDNDFYKYGNDEVIALYDTNCFVGVNDSDEISKKNIDICYNRFYCQDSNGGMNEESIINESWDGCNQRFFAFYTNQDNNKEFINGTSGDTIQRSTPCYQTINGIHFDNNEIHVNAPLSHLFTVAFDKYTTYKDITMNNNIINYGTWTVDGNNSSWKELMDFCIYYDTIYDSSVLDGNYDSFCDEPVSIIGNTIICNTHARNHGIIDGIPYYQDNHICVDIKGTKVIFNDNLVKCIREDYTADERVFARKGIEIIHCGSKGGEAFVSGNHCEGLRCLSSLTSSGSQIERFKMECCRNYLQGNPRIVHVNIAESYEFMHNNEIICDYPIFFIEEFADSGTAIFTANRVYRDLSRATYFTSPKGHIYYTDTSGSDNNIQSMRLICCDNVFDNLLISGMYSYLQTKMRTVHKNNVFADQYE